MNRTECYRILGVSPRANFDEIKRRFRHLAFRFHPDRHPNDPEAVARFREVSEAYKKLQETWRHRPHNGDSGFQRRCGAGENLRGAEDPTLRTEEFIKEYFGVEREASGIASQTGPDFRYDLQIPFAAAILGMETDIEIRRIRSCPVCQATGLHPGSTYQTCPDCDGQGRVFRSPGMLRLGPICQRCHGQGRIIPQPCSHCQGLGTLDQRQRYRITIPPGVEDGARLRIRGEGGEGLHNGPPGHLFVVIHVEPHDFFTRVGNDLYCRVEASFVEAALGAKIEVPTISGSKILDLPPGTQSGDIVRFTGYGVPGQGNQAPGDQIIEVIITTPTDLSCRQRELLHEFARLDQENRIGNAP